MPRVSQKLDEDGRLLMLGKAIAEARKPGGILRLSQEKLADAAGIDRAHMSRLERGQSNLTMLNLLRVADALDLSASDLLKRAGL